MGGVDCNSGVTSIYHDYNGIPDVGVIGFPSENFFPSRLFKMVEEAERNGFSHVISWQPHGRCFLVHDRKRFVEQILPVWFSMKSYESFQRQLNMYGFQRIGSGRDKGGYYHELFLRGYQHLVYLIKRKRLKGHGPRKPDSMNVVPDFYALPHLSPPNGIHNMTATRAQSRDINIRSTMIQHAIDAVVLGTDIYCSSPRELSSIPMSQRSNFVAPAVEQPLQEATQHVTASLPARSSPPLQAILDFFLEEEEEDDAE